MSRAPTENVFRTVVFVLAGFVLVYFAVGSVLARSWSVTTVGVVPAPPAKVAALVSDLQAWGDWASMDVVLGPGTERTVVGAAGQAGQRVTWRGPQGAVSLELTAVAATHVDYVLRAGEAAGPALKAGRIAVAPAADGARVEWREGGDYPDLAARWFGWFGAMQERVRMFQQGGLAGLQRVLAGGAK